MSDGPAVFITLCLAFAVLDYSSVVAAAVNVRMNARRGGLVSQIKDLTKQAIKTGKIKIIHDSESDSDRNFQNGVLCQPDYWDRYHFEHSWEEFEKDEALFRHSLVDKKTCDFNFKFSHSNPSIWIKTINLLCSIFFHYDNIFTGIRSDGKEFSIEFLRYIKRIIMKLPIVYPDNFTNIYHESERSKTNYFIKYSLEFSKNHIVHFLKQKQPNRVPLNPEERIVPRDELAHLWSSNQKRAINIVKNNGVDVKTEKCSISEDLLYTHFSNKCANIPLQHDLLDYVEEATPPQPEWTLQPDTFTQVEIRDVIRSLPPGKSPGIDKLTTH